MPDPILEPQCLDARERFAEALDDPAAEGAVLGHCLQCSSCMAAFTELRETVDKLVAAAEAVPPSDTFATAVVRSIQAEKRRRRTRQALGLAVVLMAATALVLAVAATLHLAGSGKPDLAPGYEWLAEEGEEPPSPEAPSGQASAPRAPNSTTTDKGGDGVKPAKPEKPNPMVDEPEPPKPGEKEIPFPQAFYDELGKLERDILLSGGRGGRGKNRARFLKVMDQGRLLTTSELKLVIDRLHKELSSLKGEGERRVRKAVIQRCKFLLKNKMSGGPPPGRGWGRRKSGK